MPTLQQEILKLIKCFRRQWPLFSNSERTTVCGADYMLMALQLSMAEVNKQHHGDFTVLLSDVLETWNYLLHEKLGLSYENMKEPENYADVKKAYHAFLVKSNMLDLIDICQKCHSLGLLPEDESIASVQLLQFISGITNIQENNGCVLSTPTQVNQRGQENMEVTILAKKSVCSYLSLLVNSKDDLALAHILNVPDRGLGREAFTSLKHVSQKRKMSIFLMATSFIRTIELGGRDCASSLYDPLRAHVKGLSNLVNFIDKLQEIVGEILNPRIAGGRILSTVKMHLIKGRSNGDPFCQAVEEVVQDLDLKIKNIIDSQQEILTASTTGVSPARPKLHSINHGTAYCGRDTVKVLLVLLDEEAVKPATQNKADLLYDYESLSWFGITSVLTLFRSPSQSNGSSPKPLRQRIQKSMDEKIIKKDVEKLIGQERVISSEKGSSSIVCFLESYFYLYEMVQINYDLENCQQEAIKSFLYAHYNCEQKNHSNRENNFSQMKQSSIKSQFACTYKNDLSEMSGQHSLSIPTCKHPAPKQHLRAGRGTEGTNSCPDVPVLGTISESVHQTRSYTEMGKLSCQPRNKDSKNEQMDLNNSKVICDKECEPSLQKNAKRLKTSNNSQKELGSKISGKRKQTKTSSKNKLIAGQAKLTQFFQL